jgi:hypothetical protein
MVMVVTVVVRCWRRYSVSDSDVCAAVATSSPQPTHTAHVRQRVPTPHQSMSHLRHVKCRAPHGAVVEAHAVVAGSELVDDLVHGVGRGQSLLELVAVSIGAALPSRQRLADARAERV